MKLEVQKACDQADELVSLAEEANHEIHRRNTRRTVFRRRSLTMKEKANATLRRAASLRCRNGQLWPLGEPKGRGLPELRLHRRSHRHWSQMKPTR